MAHQTMLPPWFNRSRFEGVGEQQTIVPTERMKVWNRTGSATVVGQLLAFDVGYAAAAETVANSQGLLHVATNNMRWLDSASCWKHVVQPATPFFANGFMCLAEEAVADNEELWVTVAGDTYMRINAVQGGVSGSMLVVGANWTDASKTITLAGAFTTWLDPSALQGIVSAKLHITAGTGVTLGDYDIATKTDANNITLASDINGASGNIADNSINGEQYLTYRAGSKIEAAAASSGGNLTNGTSANKKFALLAEQTTFTNLISSGGGQLVHVLFSGFGFGDHKLG